MHGSPAEKMGGPGGFVTVVSGLPRSGTSMMMQMLAAGGMPILSDGARAPDDDNPRGYLEFDPAKRIARDSQWVATAVGRAVKLVHLLLPKLPASFQYRVIFMRRDLNEVLASQQVMLERQGRSGADLSPDRLAEVFQSQLRRVEGWLAAQPNVVTLDVHYHDVVAQPAVQARRVNAFLGDALDEGRMAAAVDPTLYRQRRD